MLSEILRLLAAVREGLWWNGETVSWVGFDFDGTLAIYDKWRGEDYLGAPIPLVVQMVKDLLAKDVEVRIVTARCAGGGKILNVAHQVEIIETWCEEHIGQKLPVTASKDFGMLYLVDDRCVTVETNTGIILTKGGLPCSV
jgi:hypothetical protein